MIIYRLSFLAYLKEKVKEVMGFSGFCKGDIFLDPSSKAGQDILREHYHDDHILHAIKFLAQWDGYADRYCDLNAGFGAFATEVLGSFKHSFLYEEDALLRDVLRVNMSLKATPDHWTIGEVSDLEEELSSHKAIIRCEKAEDLNKFLDQGNKIILFQNRPKSPNRQKIDGKLRYHDAYLYSADMDAQRPFKTLRTLITKGYAFKLNKMSHQNGLEAGDYIFLPKDQHL